MTPKAIPYRLSAANDNGRIIRYSKWEFRVGDDTVTTLKDAEALSALSGEPIYCVLITRKKAATK